MFLFFIQNFKPTTPIQQEFYRLFIFLLLFSTIIFIIRIIIYNRRKQTKKFIFNVLDMCLEYNRRAHVQYRNKTKDSNEANDSFEWLYEKLPSEEEILYSFKPLKLSSFIDQKLIDKLQS